MCNLFLLSFLMLAVFHSIYSLLNSRGRTTDSKNKLLDVATKEAIKTTPRKHFPNRSQSSRRQKNMVGLGQLMEGFIENIKTKKKVKDHGLYEPYWVGGENMYKRTIKPRRKKRTRPPETTVSRSNTTQTSTISSSTARSNMTKTTEFINYSCQHPCSDLIENYGTVCAQRFNGWKNEIKEFFDACDMIEANCFDFYSNSILDSYRGHWHIIHRGKCSRLSTPFVLAPTNVTEILSRMLKYVDINEQQFRTKPRN